MTADYYPPGTRTAIEETTVEAVCENKDCEDCGTVYNLAAYRELGQVSLANEDESDCPFCGKERKFK